MVNLKADPYERAVHESEMYIEWYAKNTMWIFVPIQQKIKEFLSTISEFPFQEGSSLSASDINYRSLKAAAALKRLKEIEGLSPVRN